ncbi:MAG: ABC transporter permease [Gemmatimonadaceae bacterium]
MREWLARLADWVRRDRLERELTDELRFHQQQLERDALHAGVSAGEAPWTARRRLGNTTTVTENARERWSLPSLDQFQQDVRYALRGLRRSPGFTATAIVTLALGIGANAAMFGVVDRLMFRPYAYLKDPQSVHRVYLRSTFRGDERIFSTFEYTRFLDLQKHTTSFSRYAAFSGTSMAIGIGDASREHRIAMVSGTLWDFFDARPALGRFFTPAEDSTPRGAEVAVLGHAYWQSEFGGRDVRGERLQVGHILTTIIGVAPEGFSGVSDREPPAVYIPITLYAGSNPAASDRANYFTRYQWGWMDMMVRRKANVTMQQASADMNQAYRRSWEIEGEIEPPLTPLAVANPRAEVAAMKVAAGPDPGLEARTALWLTGVAAIVLLIACANVANLFLARALRRQRETAVRLALGVSRGRLMRQTLTESVLLSLLGSAAGLLVAQWGGTGMRRLLITTQGASLDVMTDWRTLGVVIGIALVAGVLTGLAPAATSGRGDLAKSLKAGAREGTYHRSRLRVALLVTQGALSVVLLVGAGLFVKSLNNVRGMRMGYDAEGALFVSRNLRGTTLDSAQLVQLRRELVTAGQAIPGIAHVAMVSSIPFWSTSTTNLYVAGIDSVTRLGSFTYQTATADFFGAMGTRILRGRGFTDADREGAPRVAVVSQGMAGVLWPGQNAIGQCMRVGSDTIPCTTVVGIAEDIVQRQNQLADARRFHYYLPSDQFRPQRGDYLIVRVPGNASAQQEPVRKALQAKMPGQSYVTVRPLMDIVEGSQRSWQLGATLFVAFGLLALAVAAIGLYGVIAYNVTQRMHELGVRVALGAQRPDILRLVVGQSARFALAGVTVGCALALVASRWVQPLLFQQSATDPGIYVAVSAIMVVVALGASMSPALRAARADPNSALRSE